MTRKFLLYMGLFALAPALLLAAGSAFASTVRIVVPATRSAKVTSPMPRSTAPP